MLPVQKIDNTWYYLENFEFVLHWVGKRYSDLLDTSEHHFIQQFLGMPRQSRAVLVRMIMRNGVLFRRSKLRYTEIPDCRGALLPLIATGWVNDRPLLSTEQLFGLLRKPELVAIFDHLLSQAGAHTWSKPKQLSLLQAHGLAPRCFDAWVSLGEFDHPAASPAQRAVSGLLETDEVYEHSVGPLCDRFRLMFFGNLRQDWSEFVLTELGRYTYEKIDFPLSSRAFQARHEIDGYLHLHACKERVRLSLEKSDSDALTLEIDEVLGAIPGLPLPNSWLESRRQKLLFQIARHQERQKQWSKALETYTQCTGPEACVRRVRTLERAGERDAAAKLAQAALLNTHSEAQGQQLLRMLPRLLRDGQARPPSITFECRSTTLLLAQGLAPMRVELQVAADLAHSRAPVFYVENALVTSLFGLLCWDAIFAAVPGAFFHPFQQGPSDLLQPEFHQRREALFRACFSSLESGEYRRKIQETFGCKAGLQSTLVAWDVLTQPLLELALSCIPAAHLRKLFERLLDDLNSNRTGLPDLIQFWPHENRYEMIEVKGPGDRLQDNQLRWLMYCHQHDIPASVCYVRYEQSA
jgi:hypothetical protein